MNGVLPGWVWVVGLSLMGGAAPACGTPEMTPDGRGGDLGGDVAAEDRAEPQDRPDGTEGDGADGQVPVAVEPALPQLVDWSCPPGWAAEEILSGTPAAHRICNPPALPESCPAGMRPAVGQSSCVLVGPPCPAGDYPEKLPEDLDLLYVRAGAQGGDGLTPETPFGTLAEALAVANASTVVAVAKGRYEEAVTLSGGASLWGACATETIIAAPGESASAGTVNVRNLGGTLRNLTVTGDRYAVGQAGATSRLLLEGVILDGARNFGVFVAEGRSTRVEDVLITGTRGGGTLTVGIGLALSGGKMTVRDTAILDSQEFGLSAYDAEVSLEDVVVRGVEGQAGVGLNLDTGLVLNANRLLVDRVARTGISIAIDEPPGTPPVVTATDLVVRDTIGTADDGTGAALIGTVGEIRITRGLLEGNHFAAALLAAQREGETVTAVLDQVAIRGTAPNPAEPLIGGWGLLISSGTNLTATRLALVENSQVAVAADSSRPGIPAAALTFTDVAVQGTREVDGFAMGFSIGIGTQGTLERAWLADNGYVSAFVYSFPAMAETRFDLTDVTLAATAATVDGSYGDGLSVRHATLQATRLKIAGSARAGVSSFGATVKLRDATLECNVFHLDAETLDEAAGAVEDQGGNVCRCAGAVETCQVVSSSLAPPEPPPLP